MSTSLIIGSAGCAKTSYLIDRLKEEIQNTPIQKIAFISYTKAAVKEAKKRVQIAFPDLKKEDLIYISTLHSLCFKILGIGMGRMLDAKLKNHFETSMGDVGQEVQFGFDESLNLSKRNLPFYLDGVSKNRMQDIEEIYNKQMFDASISDIRYVLNNYAQFKKYYNVLDYTDLLINVLQREDIEPLDVDVVFLDEAQDNSKLMYAVFYKLFQNAKKVYVGGDDLQNIFSWNGTDVKEFLNLKHDHKKILEKSYRLPLNILDYSRKIVDRIPVENRFNKKMYSDKPDGVIEKISSLDVLKDYMIETTRKGESWFILVRNIYLYSDLRNDLYENGIPFMEFGTNSYVYEDLEAILLYEDYRSGKIQLTDKHRELLKNYAPIIGDKSKTWYEAFSFLSLESANYYRHIVANKYYIRNYVKNEKGEFIRPKIEISTIHRTKGREADHVVVLPDMSGQTHRMSEIYKDEEHRVFYTACTRCKKSLYILEPQTQLYYDLNL